MTGRRPLSRIYFDWMDEWKALARWLGRIIFWVIIVWMVAGAMEEITRRGIVLIIVKAPTTAPALPPAQTGDHTHGA